MNKGLAMVIGMSIAYFASFLGLVLAWVSYRRHNAESRRCRVEAAMTSIIPFFASAPIGHPVLGYVLPGLIFIVAFIATWLLYRHFSKHS